MNTQGLLAAGVKIRVLLMFQKQAITTACSRGSMTPKSLSLGQYWGAPAGRASQVPACKVFCTPTIWISFLRMGSYLPPQLHKSTDSFRDPGLPACLLACLESPSDWLTDWVANAINRHCDRSALPQHSTKLKKRHWLWWRTCDWMASLSLRFVALTYAGGFFS